MTCSGSSWFVSFIFSIKEQCVVEHNIIYSVIVVTTVLSVGDWTHKKIIVGDENI